MMGCRDLVICLYMYVSRFVVSASSFTSLPLVPPPSYACSCFHPYCTLQPLLLPLVHDSFTIPFPVLIQALGRWRRDCSPRCVRLPGGSFAIAQRRMVAFVVWCACPLPLVGVRTPSSFLFCILVPFYGQFVLWRVVGLLGAIVI